MWLKAKINLLILKNLIELNVSKIICLQQIKIKLQIFFEVFFVEV